MKKIITFCAAMTMLAHVAQAQSQEYEYHPWKDFKGDTTAFLDANFPTNIFFKNKTIKSILEILDKEMPVKQIIYFMTYPDGQKLQTIELIFDDRKQWKNFDQLHFFLFYFDKEYNITELQTIFGAGPEQIIPLTKTLRQRLNQFGFQEHAPASIFSASKLIDPSSLPPEVLKKFKDPVLDE